MADGFHHAPHLAVAAFGDGDAVPAVGALAAAVFDAAELGDAVVEAHAIEQLLFFLVAERAEHAHGVLALEAEARVHQPVGQLAGVGEQQQAFGVEVEPADGLPLALVQPGQLAEHRGPVLRVVVGDDLAGGLVVGDDAGGRRLDAHAHRLAVDLDLVAVLHALADVRGLIVDGDTPFGDEALHLQP
jgi:hypothetical protein